ncbi:MAG: GNAT family N-acetyltransferase [Bacteroidia bacterium]|nr:MAG: GNAT family N-acetyltransferase [Bacteroidia bacterium]
MHQILIKPLEINDSAVSYQWRNNPEIWEFTGSRPNKIITREIEKEWLKNVLNDNSSKRFAILCDDKYIGNVQLTSITETKAEFHIFIGEKDFWGKGISQLATYQILYYAKEVLKLTSIQLSVNKNNRSAIKSYQNNNFKITEESDEMIKMSIDLKDLNAPMVSVFVMVYNHEPYLKECLDGVLMQKCNFNFDIVVGEDFSTDNSRNILLEYQKKYPGKFKLLLHEQNIGAVANQNAVFKACSGKYIALCEGDDYWTDPLKLQKQVDFLETNFDCVAVGHKRMILDNLGKQSVDKSSNIFNTQCMVFRNIIKPDFSNFLKNTFNADTFLLYYLLNKGKIVTLDFIGAVYRFNGDGIYSGLSEITKVKHSINTFKMIHLYFITQENKKLHRDVKHIYHECYSHLFFLTKGKEGFKDYVSDTLRFNIFLIKPFIYNLLRFLKFNILRLK